MKNPKRTGEEIVEEAVSACFKKIMEDVCYTAPELGTPGDRIRKRLDRMAAFLVDNAKTSRGAKAPRP